MCYEKSNSKHDEIFEHLESFQKLDKENLNKTVYYAKVNYLLGKTDKAK